MHSFLILHSNFKKRSKSIIEFMTAQKSNALVCDVKFDTSTEFDQWAIFCLSIHVKHIIVITNNAVHLNTFLVYISN